MKVTGRLIEGVGDFKRRMSAYPEVFERAVGEPLFPGTLNVEIAYELPCREDIRIRGVEIGEAYQDLLIEHCAILGRRAYRIRPFQPATGGGGHGDHVLEIACATALRPLLVGKEERVEIEFFRER